MAYFGRGNFSTNGNNNLGSNGKYFHHRGLYYRRRIVIDSNYILIQMLITFLIFILGVVGYISNYESKIEDPLESIKSTYINVYLICIVCFLGINFIINQFAKSETSLLNKLSIFFIISILTMFSFFGVRLNFDSKYNKVFFEKIAIEQNLEDTSTKKDILNSKLDLGLGGISLKTEKQYFLDECDNLYKIFQTKTYGILGLHLLFNLLLFYQIVKIIKTINKKDKMDKNDAILFDEEQNIKI